MQSDQHYQRPVAIQFRKESFQETMQVADRQTPGRPQALMGREVASNSFLRALLRYGQWSKLEAVIESDSDRELLNNVCREELSSSSVPRHVHVTPLRELSRWLRGERTADPRNRGATEAAEQWSGPPARVWQFPHPPEPRFAWARQRYCPNGIALSGVTHTLCSPLGLEMLWQMIQSPFYPYDRLISTSTAVTRMIRSTTDVMCQYLSQRTKGDVEFNITVEQLPLAVDVDHHRVATPIERNEARLKLGIQPDADDVVLLFVGRLSHHAKAQPFPMFVAAQQAAELDRGRQIHLVLAGWFANEPAREAFIRCAARTAPNIKLHIVDGLNPWWRDHVWDAADVFVSLADSIQETFGLTNIEAMSRGLPVVATDWNGYRDTVVNGETGFLVPTAMVQDANEDATARVLTGEMSYDQYLGEVGQTVLVSTQHACDVIKRLVQDPDLRSRMGQAGRARAESKFAWQHVIGLYEAMWFRQRDERVLFQQAKLRVSEAGVDLPTTTANSETVAVQDGAAFPTSSSPARYPPVDTVFQSYPSVWLNDASIVAAAKNSVDALQATLADRLLVHSAGRRLAEQNVLSEVLQASSQPASIGKLVSLIQSRQKDASASVARATIAWMLKYDLIRSTKMQNDGDGDGSSATTDDKPILTFVTTCKGRLEDLQNTLPRLVVQPKSRVVVVDYSCPQNCGEWVRENFPQVTVVEIPGKEVFDRCDAKNSGVRAANTPWICLIDADVELAPEFSDTVTAMLQPGSFYRSSHPGEGTGGTFIVHRDDFDRVGGHDPVFQGWGEEDDDLIDALKFIGLRVRRYPASLIRHRDHDDDARTLFHQDSDRRHSHMINRIYRCGKWDLARLSGVVAPIERRQALYNLVEKEVRNLIGQGKPGKIRIDTGSMRWTPIASHSRRILEYTVTPATEDMAGNYEPSHQPKG